MNAPLDDLHADCLIQRQVIRDSVARLQRKVAEWEPRRLPPRNLSPLNAIVEVDRPRRWFRTGGH